MQTENLAQLFHELDLRTDDAFKAQLRALPERDLWQMHLGCNSLIRTLAFYSNESVAGRDYFARLGEPDDASSVLGEWYWRYLNGVRPDLAAMRACITRHCWFLLDEEAEEIARCMLQDYPAD